MKTLITLLLLLAPSLSFAQAPSAAVIAVFERADHFFEVAQSGNGIDLDSAQTLSNSLHKIALDAHHGAEVQSQAYVYYSGVEGRMAEALGLRGGKEHGTNAFFSLKSALSLDPKNKDAANSFGQTIQQITQQNRLIRKVAVFGLGIDLNAEAATAMRALENTGLTHLQCYSDLKAFLQNN